MLGLYYVINGKNMMGEGLYRQVLDNFKYGSPDQISSNNLGMALSFYGNMLR